MEILDLKSQGLSISHIATRTGHDRKTVRSVLSRNGAPLPRRHGGGVPKDVKLEPYKQHLDRRMAQGVFNAVVLFEEIRKMGYRGGLTVLRGYVREHRPRRPFDATMRFETGPGEQAQVDFVDIPVHHPDGSRTILRAFSYVLAYSRLWYVEFMPAASRVHFLRGLDHAFRATGGVPRTVLSDNLTAAVIGRDENGKAVFAPEYLTFARHYGFTPRACQPGRAQTKGKVERPGRYLQENWLARVQGQLDHVDLKWLNRSVADWLDTVANVREHGTTHERPVDRFARDEVQTLRPVPLAPFGLDEVQVRNVSRDGFVRWKTCMYSVPWRLAGRDVIVRETAGGTLRIEYGTEVVASWPVSQKEHAVHEDPAHREGLRDAIFARPGLQLAAPTVEHRPLDEYEALAQAGVR